MSQRSSIAIIGSGISGLSAAWLLSQRHSVTLFEADTRAGGHSNTVDVAGERGPCPVDTGFIVYNTASYPNLIALFDHLGVTTAPTAMSFAVSMDHGGYEYSGNGLPGLFGQRANLVRPSHWRMIVDILRFFREAPKLVTAAEDLSLGQYLTTHNYSDAFIERHILPMAAAIWSTPSRQVLAFPAASFVRFFSNHGLLQVNGRPQWRTVVGGSRAYVRRLLEEFRGEVRLGEPVTRVERDANGVAVSTSRGTERFSRCVMATHADDTLSLLADADSAERAGLSAFRYAQNTAILHSDVSAMPQRRRLWSSWNYLTRKADDGHALSVTYWMNNLQPLPTATRDLFVTLNPIDDIHPARRIATFNYAHPIFDAAAMQAQKSLWQLQGRRHTWFCGSYWGYGFHEDGLQSGLAAAEDLSGVKRPWHVANESGRIHLAPVGTRRNEALLEAAE